MQAKTQQAITSSSESPDTPFNFQGYPALRAGQRGSHKPATAKVGSCSLLPALPTHGRSSQGDARHRRDRASPHPTPVSTLHVLGARVLSPTAWPHRRSGAQATHQRSGRRATTSVAMLLHLHLLSISKGVRAHLAERARRLVAAHLTCEGDHDAVMLQVMDRVATYAAPPQLRRP